MANILMICTANICRSPVAEAVLRDRLHKRGLTDWVVSSAGTWAQIRGGASRNSVIVMQNEGLDISNHTARMVNAEYLQEADLVLCMEPGHAEALRFEFANEADKIYVLSAMVGFGYGINDPYGGPLKEYEQMAMEVTDLIERGLDKIITLAEENEQKRTAA